MKRSIWENLIPFIYLPPPKKTTPPPPTNVPTSPPINVPTSPPRTYLPTPPPPPPYLPAAPTTYLPTPPATYLPLTPPIYTPTTNYLPPPTNPPPPTSTYPHPWINWKNGSFPFVPPPSLVGAYYLHPPDARAICLHNDLLCNGTCFATGGRITCRGGAQTEKIRKKFNALYVILVYYFCYF